MKQISRQNQKHLDTVYANFDTILTNGLREVAERASGHEKQVFD